MLRRFSSNGLDDLPQTTPTGIETAVELRSRRQFVLGLNAATYLVLCLAVVRLCAAAGWTFLDIAILVAFMVAAPWSVLGFWNGVLGFWLLRRTPAWTAPFAQPAPTPLSAATAVVMTLRNEDAVRAVARLRATKASLDATGHGAHFAWFVLSDSDDAGIAAAEEDAFTEWQATAGADGPSLHYRRRAENTGYKAGNIRDFCERWGDRFAFMLLFDADSLMSGETIVDLVRLAQMHPRLGIAQTLAVGLPTASGFARLFQFGMRHGLRTYMTGAAWWGADCGSFWGHNALVRIAPYVDHCRLPVLPGQPPWGGPVMAHDQVEAALMRRGGFEVRVFPQEAGSFEDAPPDLIAYTTRDLRWCQGNLQYRPLIGMPGLAPASRFQLFWAAMMFYGMPAWSLLLVFVALRALAGGFPPTYPVGLAASVYLAVLGMGITPKLAGFASILMSRLRGARVSLPAACGERSGLRGKGIGFNGSCGNGADAEHNGGQSPGPAPQPSPRERLCDSHKSKRGATSTACRLRADSSKPLNLLMLRVPRPDLCEHDSRERGEGAHSAFAPDTLASYGGAARFCAGCILELVASFLVKAITEFRVSLFMLGLACGRSVVWSGQVRDADGIRWRAAAAIFWPHTLFGTAILTSLVVANPILAVWSLPLTAGLVLAIPLAVVTADARVGNWFVRTGLCGTPEEFDPPPVMGPLALPVRATR